MSKYCPEIVDKICGWLAENPGRTYAAEAGGISYNTFLDWLDRHPGFEDRVKRAEKQFGEKVVKILVPKLMEQALDGQYVCSFFLLKGYKPEMFGDKIKQEIIDRVDESSNPKKSIERVDLYYRQAMQHEIDKLKMELETERASRKMEKKEAVAA